MKAVAAARKALKVKGFCAVGGKSAAGKRLLAKARALYKKWGDYHWFFELCIISLIRFKKPSTLSFLVLRFSIYKK